MFERGDRSIRSGHWPLIAVIVIIAAAGAVGLFLWTRIGLAPMEERIAQQSEQELAPPIRPDEPLALTMYMPVDGMLERISAGIFRQPELQLEARAAAAAVLASERAGEAAILQDLELRALYLDPAGTVYLDLAARNRKDLQGSAWDELLTVYALVNTMTQNFAEIRQVRFLVDGREAQTLAGHVDLSRAFVRRNDLIHQRSSE